MRTCSKEGREERERERREERKEKRREACTRRGNAVSHPLTLLFFKECFRPILIFESWSDIEVEGEFCTQLLKSIRLYMMNYRQGQKLNVLHKITTRRASYVD